MKPETITSRVISKAITLLENNPNGLHTTELKRMIEGWDPTLHPKTINGLIWKLPQNYPEIVYKPSRGILRLTKFK